MVNKFVSVSIISFILGGCASVPMESATASNEAKKFNQPAAGKAGVYIYRDSLVGQALKKDIWLDGKCVGESAPNTFFYEAVEGDTTHEISTESEFSPNKLAIKTDSGENYFVRQYIKIGVFVGGANLEVVDKDKGMKAVSNLELAKGGMCSK